MNKPLLLAVMLVLIAGLSAQVRTCYEIQYTDNPNGNSPFSGQSVTVQGIVVAEKFYTGTSTNNYGFVISDPDGGPWSGLLVFTNQYQPARGDLVQVTGTITEYYEFTEMSPTTGFQVISSGNPLPQPTVITTDQLTGTAAEQWESVFVRVQDVTITAVPNNYGEFYVNNSSAAAQVDDQCFPRSGFSWPQMTVGQSWARIQGVVDFSFDYYGLNPRDLQDIVQTDTVANATVSVQTTNASLNTAVDVPVITSRLKPNWYISSYSTVIAIDPSKIIYQGIKTNAGTITPVDPEVTVSTAGDLITISYQSQEPISSAADDLPLFYLVMEPQTYGEALITIQSFSYDNTPINSLFGGKVLTKINTDIAFLNIGRAGSVKNAFNPELNEKITIEYGCRAVATGINTRAIVRIYDAQGRLVATPVNKTISSSLGIESIQWDGRDTNMKLLPIGLYYCHLEVIDRASGAKEITVQPIVIKSNLK